MFEKLSRKWGVNGWQLVLVLIVFAITGSLTAYITKTATSWLGLEDKGSKILLRAGMLLFGYWILLLVVAFVFGQFSFFWKWERAFFRKLTGKKKLSGKTISTTGDTSVTVRIAILASGTGSNAEKILKSLEKDDRARVVLIGTNNPSAGVIHIAAKYGIDVLQVERERFFRGDAYLPAFKSVDLIFLAGFLWKVPRNLIEAFPRRMINIHPALLPRHGGKGMYGRHVHEAVLKSEDPESGITIHYVDEHYDNGDIILQKTCPVLPADTPESLAQRIHELEHQYYPEVVKQLVSAFHNTRQ